MSPQEFWTVADEKRKQQRIGDLTVREIEELQAMIADDEGTDDGAR